MSGDDPRRDAYASLADELNDADVTMTVADFDPEMVELARRYASLRGLAFPPGLGDFDRFYIEVVLTERCLPKRLQQSTRLQQGGER